MIKGGVPYVNYADNEYQQMKEQIKISKHWNEEYITKVVETALEKGRPICGVKTRKGTPCRNPPTNNGRCSVPQHQGGANKLKGNKNAAGNKGGSAPEKNKNALKTGEYETIWLDCLDDDEKDLFKLIDVDVMKQLDEEIKLTTLRERRMLQRIANLTQVDFTEVERKYKKGTGPEGPVSIKEGKKLATLGQIQDIEEALTRVQSRKARLLSIKHKIIDGADPNKERGVANFLTRLRKSVQNDS